jgi:hypothetical protein
LPRWMIVERDAADRVVVHERNRSRPGATRFGAEIHAGRLREDPLPEPDCRDCLASGVQPTDETDSQPSCSQQVGQAQPCLGIDPGVGETVGGWRRLELRLDPIALGYRSFGTVGAFNHCRLKRIALRQRGGRGHYQDGGDQRKECRYAPHRAKFTSLSGSRRRPLPLRGGALLEWIKTAPLAASRRRLT